MTPPITSPQFKSVCVVGLGYIGLPTAVVLAQAGLDVLGVDINERNVEMINRGELPFVEEGLGTALAGVVAQGKLRAALQPEHADAYIVAVPTPFKGDHEADLSYIKAASETLAPTLKGGELVVLESTSPPGATEQMAQYILAKNPGLSMEPGLPNSVYFAHCPERVLPGRIMIEMAENDRIIGGVNPEGAEMARSLYSTFCNGELLVTDAKTAEMAKLTENAFRDVNIAFANELSIISDHMGIDVWELIELANHHPRVNILQPGPGVGGHCIAVDPWFIVSADRENSRLIATARNVNDSKPQLVISKVLEKAERFKAPTVAALGIAFKANIDDLRESPSRNIANDLAEKLADGTVLVVEPNIEELPKDLAARPNVELAELDAALERADIVLLLVDHDQFKQVPSEALQEKILIDTKGLWR